jgi:L-lactate dehydrogenase complex protein LldF
MQKIKNSFNERSHIELQNPLIRSNFRRAMDGLMEKRKAQFPDEAELSRLRDLAAAIRQNALAKLPELLEQLETRCRLNGIQVHWAQTTDEACEIVLQIAQKHDARSVIKGKSMVSEEMDLNRFMEAHGIECLESDLGEYLVQIAGETPSHIIMPVIHKNREQIAQLMADKHGTPYTDDVNAMTQNARALLRDKFMQADIGISGVNFAVAESGTLCLVENEGNGRMSTTTPPVHIAVMGIEKVVERLEHVPPLLSLLTRSATGQHITTYFNMITSPRKPGEKDGPGSIHLVLLDNERTSMYSDAELRDTLRCIRCGACINHCPVYTRVGGHAYGAVYPGPIGKLVTSQMYGMEVAGDLPTACTLCGACGEVCPVKIPIPDLLKRLRQESVEGHAVKQAGARKKLIEAMVWKTWAILHRSPVLYRLMTWSVTRMRWTIPAKMGKCTISRQMPAVASRSLHERLEVLHNEENKV